MDRAEASVSVAPEAKKTQAKKKIADFSRNKLVSGQVPSNYQLLAVKLHIITILRPSLERIINNNNAKSNKQ